MRLKLDDNLMRPLFALAAGLLAVLAYWPGLSGGFALDDYTNVVLNPAIAIRDLSWDSLSHAAFSFQAGPAMRPLSMVSFALNAYFTGPNGAMAFKATNLAIHLLNGLLVWALLQRMLAAWRAPESGVTAASACWLAVVTAAFWVLHPLNAMPVLYVVQRETALSTLFVLLGLYTYVVARTRHDRAGALMIWLGMPLLTLLAVLCKESGALLPVYAFAVELFIFRFRRGDGSFDRGMALLYGLFLLLPACLGLGWALFSHDGGVLNYAGRDFDLRERLLSETRVVWDYIRWTLLPWPASLGLYHDDIAVSRGLLQPVTTLFALLGLLGLAIAIPLLRRRWPLVALGIAWFLGGQLMESSIFPLELAYEHRCYLPDLGLILAAISLLYPLTAASRRPQARLALLATLLMACTAVTASRSYDWRDNLSFATAEARHHPESPYATYMLGQTYANLALMTDRNQYDNAVASLRAASAVKNSTIIPDVSLVLVQAQIHHRVDPDVLPRIAAKMGERKIAASDIQGLAALGECVDKHNCEVPARDMRAVFDSALANPHLAELRDTHANILVIYGNYTAITGADPRKARELMGQAAELVPAEPQYRENMVTMDISLGDRERALKDLEGLRSLNYLGHLDPVIAELQRQIDDLPADRTRP
ncbi:MAG TPA: hypothetical protein VHP13_12230 [Gammaproteobacteria bacterium]|jgi:hypothetical protein|nr:hypothetical protein [Gammaproteobacteria bacterium]